MQDGAETRPKSTEHGSALEKALLVLTALVRSRRATGLADLTREIDLPRQTIHRVLRQLADAGLILRAPKRDQYIVGPSLTQLSVEALTSLNTQAPVRTFLEMLVHETGETCNVGILDQREIVYIERMDGLSPLRLQLQIGSRVPVHCTAIGKLLLAHQHKNVRTRLLTARPLERFTSTTLTETADLEKEFAAIRSGGYAFNNEEYVDGLNALAVPIYDQDKKAVAGLAVHAPTTRMDADKALTYLPSMIEKARRISDTWGLLE